MGHIRSSYSQHCGCLQRSITVFWGHPCIWVQLLVTRFSKVKEWVSKIHVTPYKRRFFFHRNLRPEIDISIEVSFFKSVVQFCDFRPKRRPENFQLTTPNNLHLLLTYTELTQKTKGSKNIECVYPHLGDLRLLE